MNIINHQATKIELGPVSHCMWLREDVSINNEYEYENDFKPYSYS